MTAETSKMVDIVDKNGVERKVYRGGRRSSLSPEKQIGLLREIAFKTDTHKNLGEKYGLSQQAVSHFAKTHALRIDDIREHASNEFAGIPLAVKANRIQQYQYEVESSLEHPNADHHEWSKARQMAMRNIAEELGQLPPKQTITVIPVQHVIVGINMEEDL